MKMYKGFNKDLQCTPNGKVFQYEVGKTYEETDADLCSSGFHACEAPLDVFGYYPPSDSRYCEVDLDDVSDERDSDTKRVGKKITIGAEIGIPGLVKAHVEWVKQQTKDEKTGGYMSALTGGYMSALTGGYMSALTGGNMSALTGGDMSALTGGNRSALTGGYMSALTGGDMSALTGGNRSALTGGYRSALTGGDMSALTGGNRSALRGGELARFRGGMWSVFAAEMWDDGNLIGVKTGVVDGVTLKPNTWYTLRDGEFVEVNNG